MQLKINNNITVDVPEQFVERLRMLIHDINDFNMFPEKRKHRTINPEFPSRNWSEGEQQELLTGWTRYQDINPKPIQAHFCEQAAPNFKRTPQALSSRLNTLLNKK